MAVTFRSHFNKEVVTLIKLRITGEPEHVRNLAKALEEILLVKRVSKEYKRKYRYNDEISIYLDIGVRT